MSDEDIATRMFVGIQGKTLPVGSIGEKILKEIEGAGGFTKKMKMFKYKMAEGFTVNKGTII
jgi:hypothetical protein